MWSPWSEADPAEVCLAALVLALHVVATPVLLDGGAALWTLLRVRRQPVACLAVVLALLQPLLDQDAVHLMSINEVTILMQRSPVRASFQRSQSRRSGHNHRSPVWPPPVLWCVACSSVIRQ